MRWPVVGLVLLAACLPARPVTPLPAQTELERQVAAAGLEAWRAVGLPTTPAVSALMRLRIEQPATLEAYERACGPSNACLSWRDGGAVPVAYVSPLLTHERNIAHAALHEWLHAAIYRLGRRGDYDAGHTDLVVWEQGGPDSVETRAERILDGPDIGAPAGGRLLDR